MTTLNGIPRSWDSFIQGICDRRNLVTFSRLWEECSQEEAQISAREENMGSEDQALTVQSNKIKTDHHRGKHSHQKNNTRKYNKYLSKFICYRGDERGHLARDCPRSKYIFHERNGNNKIHHAHAAEDYDPSKKRIKQDNDDP